MIKPSIWILKIVKSTKESYNCTCGLIRVISIINILYDLILFVLNLDFEMFDKNYTRYVITKWFYITINNRVKTEVEGLICSHNNIKYQPREP